MLNFLHFNILIFFTSVILYVSNDKVYEYVNNTKFLESSEVSPWYPTIVFSLFFISQLKLFFCKYIVDINFFHIY